MEEAKRFSNGKIAGLLMVCILTVGSIFAGMLYLLTNQEKQETARREQIIALNEIANLTKKDGINPAEEEIQQLRNELVKSYGYSNEEIQKIIVTAGVIVVGMILLMFGYVYGTLIRPFRKLEDYAGEVAKGNLDIPLLYERNNMFGAFTWAFDHMRREIKKARSCEKEAIENNKTVVATLSHDIKTPIASIRAYAEGLEANMDTTLERKQRYLSVIMKKCDEVTTLTNDLFLHSLADLKKLQIMEKEENIKEILEEVIEELNGDTLDIVCVSPIHSATVCCDRKRVIQVLENVINNARKYASQSGISVWSVIEKKEQRESQYEIHIKDCGEGILPEDMPFIFEKFYRGKNVAGAPGAGLGLYIVKYIMEQMNGRVMLNNSKDGLEVVLVFNL